MHLRLEGSFIRKGECYEKGCYIVIDVGLFDDFMGVVAKAAI